MSNQSVNFWSEAVLAWAGMSDESEQEYRQASDFEDSRFYQERAKRCRSRARNASRQLDKALDRQGE